MDGWARFDEAKEARGDGRDARRANLPLSANPFPPGSRPWSAFNEGWRFEDTFPPPAAAFAGKEARGMPITLYADFANADTLTGVAIEAGRLGATLYLRHAASTAGAERALAISLTEFDAVAREVARFRTLDAADGGHAGGPAR
jgi:hypothetical protein